MNTPDFLKDLEDTFNQCLETARRKNADYAGTGDPFKNFKNVEVLGICSVEAGILTRMTDKMSRISNLTKQDAQVKDESIIDTLMDLINYAAILKSYLKSKKEIKLDSELLDNSSFEITNIKVYEHPSGEGDPAKELSTGRV